MNYREMEEAVGQARRTIQMADLAVQQLLPLLVGRLEKADPNTWRYRDNLRMLKKELKNYNSVTGKWKES